MTTPDGDGFDSSPSNFQPEQYTPAYITNTLPIQVTLGNHGFQVGYALRFTQMVTWPPSNATGMEQLNNNLYYVQFPTTNTFILVDKDGNYIDGTGFTPFTGDGNPQMTLTGPNLYIQNPAPAPPP
jgi:2',3'-cyclic-nucleotide 2'-phosphodiesterase (5'-nucleotidase family)